MELIRGNVSDLRADEGARQAVFQLAGHTVRLRMRCAPVLREGDDVAVWGRRKGNTYRGAAYRNLTRGVTGYPPGLAARSVVGLFAIGGGGWVLEGLYTGRIGPALSPGPFGISLAGAGIALVAGLILMLDGARWSARIRAL